MTRPAHPRRRHGRTRGFLMFLATAGAWVGPWDRCAAAPATWVNPVDGTWDDPTFWSTAPLYPNNGSPPGTSYDVTVGATGAAYRVRVQGDLVVDSFTLDSPDATMLHVFGAGGGPAILNTATISLQRGTYLLQNGTIRNATIHVAPGADFVANAGYLENVKLTRDALLRNITVRGGLTLPNLTITAARYSGADERSPSLVFDGTQTLGGSGTIVFDGPTASTIVPIRATGGGTLTIGPGITIASGAAGGMIGSAPHSFSNPIANDDRWVNQGTISSRTPGAAVYLAGRWRNEGMLRLSDGTLVMAGTFSAADVGALQRTGGTLAIAGHVENTGATFEFNAATGPALIGLHNPGHPEQLLRGGTLRVRDGVDVRGTNGSRFQDVTLEGRLVSDQARFSNLTLAAGATLSIRSTAGLGFNGSGATSEMIAGSGAVVFDGDGGPGAIAELNYASNAPTHAIGAGATVRTGTGAGRINIPNLVNHGTIIADGASKYVAINQVTNFPWRNEGLLVARNGGSIIIGGDVPAGGLGAFDATGGTLALATRLNNAGHTLALAGPGNVISVASNGGINGGTVSASGGAMLRVDSSFAIFDGVTLDTDVFVANQCHLVAWNGTRIAAGRTIRLDGLSSIELRGELGGQGQVVFDTETSSIRPDTGQTSFALGPGVTARTGNGLGAIGQWSSTPVTFTNRGTIVVDAHDTGIVFGNAGNTFVNEGRLRVAAALGSMSFEGSLTNSGTVEVQDGAFVTRAALANTGTIDLNDTMVVNYTGASPLAGIEAQVRQGYAGGAWTGAGITSSGARAAIGSARETAVGVALATDLFAQFPALFHDIAVDSTTVLLQYTLAGDANLDGRVNLSDFNRLAAHFGGTSARWSQGDFNYDGTVNLQDFNRLAANFGVSAAGPELTPADWAALASAVPEPGAALVPLAVGSILLRRRVRTV